MARSSSSPGSCPEALEEFHEKGLIYGHLKPWNIFVENYKRIILKVQVFEHLGTAMARAAEPPPSPGSIGSPSHMAPEQESSGDPRDGRSEIYAVG